MLLGGWVGDRRPSATLIPTSSKVIREKCDLLDGGSLSHVVIISPFPLLLSLLFPLLFLSV